MHFNRFFFTGIILIIISSISFSGCTIGEKSGELLYQEKCDKCHALRSPQTFTAEEWPSVIDRMQSHDPEWIKDEDKVKIIEHMQANAKN